MSDFNPGDGWREVFTEDERIVPALRYVDGINEPRWFVHAELVPPLPTEPYTVIRVTWRDSNYAGAIYMLHSNGKWGPYEAGYMHRNITGWEVLSEPRVVTAKAVVKWLTDHGHFERADDIAEEFGVES